MMLICFEGLDGSGKTTQMKMLGKWLTTCEIPFYITREPTDTKLGRALNKKFSEENVDEYELFLMIMADRLSHIFDDISEKMEQGYLVLCDRFYLSTTVYQSHIDEKLHFAAIKMVQKFVPDMKTIFFDVPPQVCMERLKCMKKNMEIYENLEDLRIHYKKYKEIISKTAGIYVIDGAADTNRVFESVKQIIISETGRKEETR